MNGNRDGTGAVMSSFNGWLRRLEAKNAGDFVTVPQRDGTVEKFAAEEFFLALFCAQADAAAGVVPSGPVPDAIRDATPETIQRIEQLAASGQGGDFMRRAVECGGLLEVADVVPDLSE
jgi:hypothetical protein